MNYLGGTMTLNECKNSLEELRDIWNKGNHDSLSFCRYIRQALEELSWEMVYATEDISAALEYDFNVFDDEVYQAWRKLKIERGECSMTLMPIGE